MTDEDLIRRGDAARAARECERQNGPLTARGATDYGKGLSAAGQAIAAAIAALPAVTQPAPDAAAIREAWERSYWRLRSYAVHDNDCKLNKPPRFDGPCSCGLTAALEEALALLTEKPHDRA